MMMLMMRISEKTGKGNCLYRGIINALVGLANHLKDRPERYFLENRAQYQAQINAR